ncbi:ABC transporter permease [Conexibacter sp. CPCC 206217]|uniref:ABC transporter permease n=1 Tax=Conexibacter sp. CPCC 206217 TaxID=3064574 RepID=UPI00271CEC58|nr:ABC transporter permease [Conexibacter sp. CPCC 206217]MDO8212621.1 ABC transporter permease [Conexibacter sp. CPCC 206217]
MSDLDVAVFGDPVVSGEHGAGGAGASGTRRRRPLARGVLRSTRMRIGLALVALVVLTALLGPLLAPHSPTEFVGAPNAGPAPGLPFGTDALGRDVLSRFLSGGRTILWLAAAATLLGVAAGALVGLVAAYARGAGDELLMRLTDAILAFPQVVLVLLAVAVFGPRLWLLVLAVALTHMPRVARVLRGAAQEVAERDFVKSAEAAGERRTRIVLFELLPNVTTPLLVELGLRLTYSIGLVAAIEFLGFGLQPPAADWGLMINENRLALAAQPWGVVLPVIAIALLSVGTNLVTDAFARTAIGLDREEG